MAAITNYTGRLVDLLIFQNSAPAGETEIAMGFGDVGEITTGVQVMSQSFVVGLLTDRGSIPDRADIGTDFMPTVRSGRMRDASDIRNAFALAVNLLKRWLGPKTGRPADESLASAELLSALIDKNTGLLEMTVRLTSSAGTVHDLFLPVPVPIR